MNIPEYPGVPQLLRVVSAAIASSPKLAISIGTLETILGSALQQAPRWGIFDSLGNQLGVSASASNSILSAVASQFTDPVLSTFSFDYMKEMRLSDFPVEGGAFASYNKVEMPANPVVMLALAGSESDRTTFLNAIDAACKSTDLFMVITPEVVYIDYSIERYTYQRSSERGATLLMVAVSLKEVRTVTAAYTVAATPILSPQNPGATSPVNSGMTQAVPPETSALKSITNKLGIN